MVIALIVVLTSLLKAPGVDFANFTYPPVSSCFPGGNVTGPIVLRSGDFTATDKATQLETETHLHSVVYGKLRSNSSLQAVVILSCDAFGLPGMYNQGFLFDVQGRRATLITQLEGGDEESGIADIRIARGLLYVDRCAADSCAQSERTAYRLNGRRLQVVRQTRHRTVFYPSY